MPVSLPIEIALDQLVSVVKTAYSIPTGHPIVYGGEIPVRPDVTNLPMAVLEQDGQIPFTNGGRFAVNDLQYTIDIYCWLIFRTTADTNDPGKVRQMFIPLIEALYSDRRLNHTVTFLNALALDTSGASRQWPVTVEAGAGVQAGYLGVQLEFVESIL